MCRKKGGFELGELDIELGELKLRVRRSPLRCGSLRQPYTSKQLTEYYMYMECQKCSMMYKLYWPDHRYMNGTNDADITCLINSIIDRYCKIRILYNNKAVSLEKLYNVFMGFICVGSCNESILIQANLLICHLTRAKTAPNN